MKIEIIKILFLRTNFNNDNNENRNNKNSIFTY